MRPPAPLSSPAPPPPNSRATPPLAEARPARRRALAVLVAGALCIAVTPVLFRLCGTGAAAAGFWRLAFALPMLAAPGVARGRPPPWRLDWTLALAGLFFAGDLVCWNESLALGSVANATVIANLSPVVVTLGAWILGFRGQCT